MNANISGEDVTVRIRPASELTLRDWRTLTPNEPGHDALLASFAVFLGLTPEQVDRIRYADMRNLQDIIAKELGEAMRVSTAFAKAMSDDDSTWTPPDTIDIDGVTYRVPRDVEMETTWGQWVDWEGWNPPEHEADIVAEALAFLLVPVGETYSGTPRNKVERMLSCRMETAMELAAFFFAKSEGFRSAINQRSNRYRELLKQAVAKALNVSPSDIEGMASSLQQQSASLSLEQFSDPGRM